MAAGNNVGNYRRDSNTSVTIRRVELEESVELGNVCSIAEVGDMSFEAVDSIEELIGVAQRIVHNEVGFINEFQCTYIIVTFTGRISRSSGSFRGEAQLSFKLGVTEHNDEPSDSVHLQGVLGRYLHIDHVRTI